LIVFMMAGAPAWSAASDRSTSGDRPMMRCRGQFDSMDADKDRAVTKQEFMAVPHPRGQAEEVFKSRDVDRDERLSEEEFCSGKGFGRGGRR